MGARIFGIVSNAYTSIETGVGWSASKYHGILQST